MWSSNPSPNTRGCSLEFGVCFSHRGASIVGYLGCADDRRKCMGQGMAYVAGLDIRAHHVHPGGGYRNRLPLNLSFCAASMTLLSLMTRIYLPSSSYFACYCSSSYCLSSPSYIICSSYLHLPLLLTIVCKNFLIWSNHIYLHYSIDLLLYSLCTVMARCKRVKNTCVGLLRAAPPARGDRLLALTCEPITSNTELPPAYPSSISSENSDDVLKKDCKWHQSQFPFSCDFSSQPS
jgi:hypothetical protein